MLTSESNPMDINFPMEFEGTFGLSTNNMLHTISIWQHPSEGYIVFELEGGISVDFDDVDTQCLIEFIKYFDYNFN